MPSHISLLENGGTVLVVGGMNKAWQTFRTNPRVIFWSGEQKEIQRKVRERSIPQNCRAVIISRFLSHTELGYILQDVRARRLTLFANKNDGEVTELLDDMLKHIEEVEGRQEIPEKVYQPPQVPIQVTPSINYVAMKPEPTNTLTEVTTVTKKRQTKRGELNKILPIVDWDKTNADNARALLPALHAQGIQTTFGALAQFLRVQRHKLGKPNVTESGTKSKGRTTARKIVKPEYEDLDVTVQMFDKLIDEMKEIRTFLVKTTKENNDLRNQMEKVKPLLDMIKAIK